MVAMITDPEIERAMIDDRRRRGIDRYDEVWEGVYVMAPLANNEHQEIAGRLTAALLAIVGEGGRVLPGANVSDRREDWTANYRCPDVAVFLEESAAEDCGTHWFGGPDFAVEIVSPGDQTRKKLDFYAAVGTRELLIVDRDPWQLELLRLDGGALRSVGTAGPAGGEPLASEVLPVTLDLVAGDRRPWVRVMHRDDRPRWLA